MRIALEEARQAAAEDEVPIGAIVVYGDRVLGRGHNMTEALGDVTAHAEMLALTAAESTCGGKYLPRCTLYVTVEPCLMCAGALGWSQIGRIVYGAPDPKRGASSFGMSRSPYHRTTGLTGGILEEECATLVKSFFAKKRR